MKLPIRSPIYKLTRDLKPLLSPDLRVLEDFEVLQLLLSICIATWPCPTLSATDCPLFASVPFLGYLCVFSCMPQLAPVSVSARFLVYFYVHCCRPLCICLADIAHGQWTSKLHAATAVFLKYCQTKGYKFSAYLVVPNQAMVIVP